MALIGGYGSREQIGANAYYTRVGPTIFARQHGAMLSLFDRVEFSIAKQRFDTRDIGAALGPGAGSRSDRTSSASR